MLHVQLIVLTLEMSSGLPFSARQSTYREFAVGERGTRVTTSGGFSIGVKLFKRLLLMLS